MKDDNSTDVFTPTPLEYSVGEVCKCYYNVIKRPAGHKVSQLIQKCQSFGRVIEKNPSDKKEYLVELFDPVDEEKTKRVPGCCLRKVKVVPFTMDEAAKNIGRTVKSNDGEVVMMLFAVCNDEGRVQVNDVDTDELLRDFTFCDNGAPCGNIVVLKADEAFAHNEDS